MYFYSYFSGHGLEILIEALGAEDPFAVAPVEIVERILAAGFTPVVDQPKEDGRLPTTL